MKNHLISILLLFLAAVAFVMRFILSENCHVYCDIIAYILPTLVAIMEMVIAERDSSKVDEELKKRPVWKSLSQEEYEKMKEEGQLDDDVYYATYED